MKAAVRKIDKSIRIELVAESVEEAEQLAMILREMNGPEDRFYLESWTPLDARGNVDEIALETAPIQGPPPDRN